ncbi:peptidoglycan/LPS O-acetylase OafA/YrhL [Microbacterium resistens]|uniref:Peptidoglycan/LPS O-acetylase OafA/YrhL n=1 Tax=Microbacterium resistens TaxID=156977 RepID=A0ABU1SC97_9MICO|nr:acyltransferase [Microbacterium resistens]MDR6867239.1 peptidoglycan/LPS O-acetylase OafA/YrhL [Microbacterium resistens]
MTTPLAASRTRGEGMVAQLFVRGRANSLNAIRLVLAACVIIWHTYAVLGLEKPENPALQNIIGGLPVNGFFAISGFLIYRSWVNRPEVGSYLRARVLRIYPAFWVCLAVTALLFAPLGAAFQGKDAGAQLFSWESLTYLVKNASLAMFQWRIGDSPADVPWLTSWNASLWTLAWEFLCYIGLMILGLMGMHRRRWLLPAAFAAAVAMNLVTLVPALNIEAVARMGRFAVFFLAGSLFAQYADRIRVNRLLVALSFPIMLAVAWAPGQLAYILQAPAVAYGLIVLGGLFNPAWAELRNDISYGVYIYAFPVQQILVIAGLTMLNLFTFSLVALVLTVPLALMSWYWVEKPMLRLRRRPAPSPARTGEGG